MAKDNQSPQDETVIDYGPVTKKQKSRVRGILYLLIIVVLLVGGYWAMQQFNPDLHTKITERITSSFRSSSLQDKTDNNDTQEAQSASLTQTPVSESIESVDDQDETDISESFISEDDTDQISQNTFEDKGIILKALMDNPEEVTPNQTDSAKEIADTEDIIVSTAAPSSIQNRLLHNVLPLTYQMETALYACTSLQPHADALATQLHPPHALPISLQPMALVLIEFAPALKTPCFPQAKEQFNALIPPLMDIYWQSQPKDNWQEHLRHWIAGYVSIRKTSIDDQTSSIEQTIIHTEESLAKLNLAQALNHLSSLDPTYQTVTEDYQANLKQLRMFASSLKQFRRTVLQAAAAPSSSDREARP